MVAEPSFVDSLFQSPLIWILIMGVLIYFIIKELNRPKQKEEEPDFGVKFRAKRVKEHLDKREKSFAVKPMKPTFLFWDIFPIGKIITTEDVPQVEKDKKGNDLISYYLTIIKYRKLGLWAWIKDIFGFGYVRLMANRDSINISYDERTKKGRYTIGRDSYFRERGGLLFLSRETGKKFLDEINADRDYENAKGILSDVPRRLSNLNPSQAMFTERMELEELLKARAKQRQKETWAGGG